MVKETFIFIAIAIVSYAIGRISHVLGGQLNTPHHWIYGVIAVLVGIIFYRQWWGIYLIALGIGFIVSDFKDMIELKFYGPDEPGIRIFWGIDWLLPL